MRAWQRLVAPLSGQHGRYAIFWSYPFAQHRIVLSWRRSGPSAHEEHLARRSSGPYGFCRCSPHEAPPREGLPCWVSVFIMLLGRSWVVEVAQEQVDRDTPVSRTPTLQNGIRA
jgi:hypothetical protein